MSEKVTRLFKDRPDLDNFRIRLEPETEGSREIFNNIAKGCVEVVSGRTFMALGINADFACFEAQMEKKNRRTKIGYLKILVCGDDFGDEGMRSVGPIIHHEISEIYALAKGENWPDDCEETLSGLVSPSCHRRALEEEYDFAFREGVAEEHLAFIEAKSGKQSDSPIKQEFLRENKMAYKRAKRKFERRK